MGKSFSGIALTVLMLGSVLSVIAPTAHADDSIIGEDVPSGLTDCSIEQRPSSSPEWPMFELNWNFTNPISLVEEYALKYDEGTSYTNQTYVLMRGLNSDTNVSITHIVSPRYNSTSGVVEFTSIKTYTGIFSNGMQISETPIVIPSATNPILEYELVVVRSKNPPRSPTPPGWGNQYWSEHPDTCKFTINYQTGDYDIDSTGVDFDLSFVAESETMWLNYTSNSSENLRFRATSYGFIETSQQVIPYYVYLPESISGSYYDYYASENQYSTPVPYNRTLLQSGTSQEDSISYSTKGYIGEFTVELLAFDEYGNAYSIKKSITLDTNEPHFTTCDFQYNRDNHSIDIEWSIPTYITAYDSSDYDVIIGNAGNIVFFTTHDNLLQPMYETIAIDPTTGDYRITVELNETRGPTHDVTIGVSFRIIEYQTSGEYYIISSCARTMKADLLMDPSPVFQHVSMVENGSFIDLNWDVTHASDVSSWDFCWSNEFFLEMDSDGENCMELNPEVLASGNVYDEIEGVSVLRMNLTARAIIQNVCNEQCPDQLYATLVPADEYGQSKEYGVLSIISFSDSDGDGVIDIEDAFPNDANETHDDDDDGVGNNSDAFPNDANETIDSDGDGVGDNNDADPQDPSVRYTSDIEVDISDRSAAMIAGAIFIFAVVVFFVRRRPPTSKDDSAFVHHESMWNDDEESTS